MKLTPTEKAQIEKQRQKQAARKLEVTHARDVLANVSDEEAVSMAKQIQARDAYITARDSCGCKERTDELCRNCKRIFDKWFFGRTM